MDQSKVFFFNTGDLEFKTEEGKEYLVGYASTHKQDLVNDIVTPVCMADMLDQFNSRNMKCDIEHETLRGKDDASKALNITKIPLARSYNNNYDGKGLEIKWLMNQDYKRFDEKGNVTLTYPDVKRMVKDKFLNAFSIAYVPIETARKSVNGVMTRLLDKVNVINVALTGNPINPEATINNVMMKSLDNYDSEVRDAKKDMYVDDIKTSWKNELRRLLDESRIDNGKYSEIMVKIDSGEYDKNIRREFESMYSPKEVKGTHIPENSGSGQPDLKGTEGIDMAENDDKKPEGQKVEAKSDKDTKDSQAEILATLKSLDARVATLEKPGEAGAKGEAGKPEGKSTPETDVEKIQADLKALKDEIETIKSTPAYKAVHEDMNAKLKGEVSQPAIPETKSAIKGPIDYIS